MAHPRKQEPSKSCEHCGKQLTRKRYNGTLESLNSFTRRKYCDMQCMGLAHRKDDPTVDAYRKRVYRHKKDHCQECGATENLQIHHIDGNPKNNRLSNLMTLCGSCHTKWHWNNGKTIPRERSTCKICGVPLKKSAQGMCQKHFQRVKKYGDPYLTKRKHGSQYVIVRVQD